ncbi:hypothetical protein ACFXJO_05845 [Streptomyces lavendulae]|uniref:hypothetical protein n=1 Tax=Streptomyces lavendulae TaxID=1914 RepID=UPI0036D1315C
MSEPTPQIARLDADLQMLVLKRTAAADEAERLRQGLLAEYSHLLHDADSDAVTRPFPYLRRGISARLIDGGQS